MVEAAQTSDIPSEADARTPDRTHWLSFAATAATAFVVYWFTLAPDVTLGWSGYLSTGAMYAGIPNAGGCPVWSLYSYVFTQLPFSNIAWRVALGSAVAASLASGLIAALVTLGGRLMEDESNSLTHLDAVQRKWMKIVCGWVAGMSLALSRPVWKTAVIADVHALGLLLFTGLLYLTLLWILHPQRKRLLSFAFLLMGMLLTNNQEWIVVIPALVGMTILGDQHACRDLALSILPIAAVVSIFQQYGLWTEYPDQFNLPIAGAFFAVGLAGITLIATTRRLGTRWFLTLLCAGAFLLGVAFYFYIPITAMTTPPANWGYPRTVEGFLHVFGRHQYEKAVPVCDPFPFLKQLWMLFPLWRKQIDWHVLVLAALPLFRIRALPRRLQKWAGGLLGMLTCCSVVLIAELNPPENSDLTLLAEYFIPSLVVFTILAGLGLIILGAWLTKSLAKTHTEISGEGLSPSHPRHQSESTVGGATD